MYVHGHYEYVLKLLLYITPATTIKQGKNMGRKKNHNQHSHNKKNHSNESRRQYSLAAILFVLILALLFAPDFKTVRDSIANNLPSFQKQQEVKKGGLSQMQVHFLDVGQGDATLITCGSHSMLIDAGNNNKGTAIQDTLQHLGITELDYIIGTHPDADHIGGLDVIITKFPSKALLMPDYEKDTKTYDEVIRAASYRHLKMIHPKAGATYQLGDASFTILGPVKKYSSANDNSICLLLQHGENRFLFTGDAEEEAESDMLASWKDLSADVYKVPHHGSKTATTEAFFDKVCPIYAVISCGQDNSYGHPNAEVLNRLRSSSVQMFRTDDQGTITASSNGTNITFNLAPSDNWTPGEPRGKK